MRRIDSQVTVDNYTFATVNEFIYLGFAVSLEIKRRITLTNSYEQLSNRDPSRTTKLILYKTLIKH